MRQFVPMTDELLNQLGALPGPLVPYHCGIPCLHALSASEMTRESAQASPRSTRDGERIAGLDADFFGGAGI
jgi:hypothetical protein